MIFEPSFPVLALALILTLTKGVAAWAAVPVVAMSFASGSFFPVKTYPWNPIPRMRKKPQAGLLPSGRIDARMRTARDETAACAGAAGRRVAVRERDGDPCGGARPRAGGAGAQAPNPPPPNQVTGTVAAERLRQDTILAVRNRLGPVLTQYCKDACQVVDIKVNVDEQFGESDDLGFEGVSGDDPGKNLYVDKVLAEIQVDDRVTTREPGPAAPGAAQQPAEPRHHRRHRLAPGDAAADRPVRGEGGAAEAAARKPRDVGVGEGDRDLLPGGVRALPGGRRRQARHPGRGGRRAGGRAGPRQVRHGDPARRRGRCRGRHGRQPAAGDAAEDRQHHEGQDALRAAVLASVQVSAFPESFSKKQERDQKKSDDPFGLEKLRQTLRIFKELAGTKEVITTSNSSRNRNAQESAATQAQSELRHWRRDAGLIGAGVPLLLLLVGGASSHRSSVVGEPRRPHDDDGGRADQGGGRRAASGGGRRARFSGQSEGGADRFPRGHERRPA